MVCWLCPNLACHLGSPRPVIVSSCNPKSSWAFVSAKSVQTCSNGVAGWIDRFVIRDSADRVQIALISLYKISYIRFANRIPELGLNRFKWKPVQEKASAGLPCGSNISGTPWEWATDSVHPEFRFHINRRVVSAVLGLPLLRLGFSRTRCCPSNVIATTPTHGRSEISRERSAVSADCFAASANR